MSSLLNEPVYCVECYPFQEAPSNFIAFAGDSTLKVHTYEIKKTSSIDVACSFVEDIAVIDLEKGRVEAIAFAPLSATGRSLTICTIDNDRSLQVYQRNIDGLMEKKLELSKIHAFDINDVVVVNERSGDVKVATGSDDHTCRIVSLVDESIVVHRFQSSIMAVDSIDEKLLVAEQSGYLHLFDLRQDASKAAQKLHTSFDRPNTFVNLDDSVVGLSRRRNLPRPIAPLLDAHIHPLDMNKIGAVAGNHYFLWDLRNGLEPLDHNVAHMPGARYFRWSPCPDNIFATASSYDTIKIWKADTNSTSSGATLLQVHKQDYRIGGLTWTNYHSQNMQQHMSTNDLQIGQEPKCCVSGGDRKLHFYVTY
jgi:WD40 repeat protein